MVGTFSSFFLSLRVRETREDSGFSSRSTNQKVELGCGSKITVEMLLVNYTSDEGVG